MHLELAPLCISRLGKGLVRGARRLVKLAVLVIRPDAADLTGTDEAGNIVDVSVGLVRVYAVAKPDYFFKIKIFFKLLLDLLTAHIGVSSLGEKAHLGGYERSLAVNMDAAALKHEVVGFVGVNILDLADLLRNHIVLIPREVKSVKKSAPGIEFPVHGANLALVVGQEGRTAVAYPCVVGRHLHNANVAREGVAAACILLLGNADRYRLKLRNRFGYLGERLLRGLCAASPVVGTLRPEHPYLFLRLKLAGHTKAVLFGGAFQSLCHNIFFLSNFLSLRQRNAAAYPALFCRAAQSSKACRRKARARRQNEPRRHKAPLKSRSTTDIMCHLCRTTPNKGRKITRSDKKRGIRTQS